MSEKGSAEAASGVSKASVRVLEMQTALGLASPGLAPGGWREACWKVHLSFSNLSELVLMYVNQFIALVPSA